MGKEQDLLDASRGGQYHIIEKILTARIKKSGPLNLTSLRRLPGPNTTDPRNGFTCLHYASLNGHKDIVRLLLDHGANPNVVDHNGSSPLHLASWTGDYEIVDMLIANRDFKADINLKNKDNETALHSACQYGHTPVASLLLTQGADPFVQNVRQETPLDLAAQYGRLDTIELLLRLRFDLLNEYLSNTNQQRDISNLARHSPLHLASRNGHKAIVKLLLDLGFDVNYLTTNGTALHEAVLCGKNEVVRMLLEAGSDIERRNDKGQKVEELLQGLNTSVAKQTKKLIKEHIQTLMATNRSQSIISPMSETTTATTIAASNSLCDQEDLTIVDSMLQEDILLYNEIHDGDDDDDDLIMDDTDVQCISPPPGYTDHPDDDHRPGSSDHQQHLAALDCVSPSSSLFSTSIFSELASIFEEHLRHPVGDDNDQQPAKPSQIVNHQEEQTKMKASNSFTSSSTQQHRFGSQEENHKSSALPYQHHHHQLSLDHGASLLPVGQNRPLSSSTTPSIGYDDDNYHVQTLMSSSLNSDQHHHYDRQRQPRPVSHHQNGNDDDDHMLISAGKNFHRDSMVSSSNYSISSAASSHHGGTTESSGKQPRPPKPPRKASLSSSSMSSHLAKACSMECPLVGRNGSPVKTLTAVPLTKTARSKTFETETPKSEPDSDSGNDDVADSDHSASQKMNSVISNDHKNRTTNKKKPAGNGTNGGTNNDSTVKSKTNTKEITTTAVDDVHYRNKPPAASAPPEEQQPAMQMSTGQSIDDFYMLYDQAAREELEQEKRRNNLTATGKHSSMDMLQKNETAEVQATATAADPPSPGSAETEIIHAIEPLKEQFYHRPATETKTTDTTKRKRKKDSGAAAQSQNRPSPAGAANGQLKTNLPKPCQSDHHHHSGTIKSYQSHSNKIVHKRDNWTLTDIDVVDLNHHQNNVSVPTSGDHDDDDQNAKLKKSIGISAQIETYPDGSKLIIAEAGRDGQPLVVPRRKHRHSPAFASQNSKNTTESTGAQRQRPLSLMDEPRATIGNHHNDYFSAFCETLKFDRKGEKENPFAGLCRGGLTPAKTRHNRNNHHQPPQTTNANNNGGEKKKKMVELSETRKSLRKQRSLLSGRAESLSKLGKLSVYNGNSGGSGTGSASEEPSSILMAPAVDPKSATNERPSASAMITQPNNIYATLRKRKKSKSLTGEEMLSIKSIDIIDNVTGSGQQRPQGIMQDQSQQIYLWLKEIDMEGYKDILIQNGYDDLDFMDNNVMDDNDLIEIGIIQASHRELILKAAQQLPYRTPRLTRNEINSWSVAQWLSNLHLKQYVDLFHKNGLVELRKIRNIWEVELETMLEIDKAGHRRRILFSLSDFNNRDSIVSDNSDALSPWYTDNASGTSTNHERDQLEWRGWKHARHELVNGSCQYLVSYLGSTLVRELRGIDSTRASIGKLKATTSNNDGQTDQILKILLSISCQGVQFKDPKSQKLICEHEIRNIHCICQDSEDLNYFAYITKDFESNNHYCHVFMSTQTDLVTEIILTLGQAFEIAYQMVLEQYNIHMKQQQHQSSSEANYETQSNCSSNYGYSTYVKNNGGGNEPPQPPPAPQVISGSTTNETTLMMIINQQAAEKPTAPMLLEPPTVTNGDQQVNIETKNPQPEPEPEPQQQQQQQPITEELYAVVDKSRKTKASSSKPILVHQAANSLEEKENRPVPPVRSSSTASSNSSTGTRTMDLQKQQQQAPAKPKPPIRVQSMQKPEVSPKPKNLLTKSNTVQLATSNHNYFGGISGNNNKPVLARFYAAQQSTTPEATEVHHPHHHHHQVDHSMTSSLPQAASNHHLLRR